MARWALWLGRGGCRVVRCFGGFGVVFFVLFGGDVLLWVVGFLLGLMFCLWFFLGVFVFSLIDVGGFCCCVVCCLFGLAWCGVVWGCVFCCFVCFLNYNDALTDVAQFVDEYRGELIRATSL